MLITGANSGVGFKTAETMVYLGAAVVMACRNAEKAAAAREKLLAEYPTAKISVTPLDLADFSSIDAFAERLPDVDVFINNAGVFHRRGEKTKDGFDLVMGTNYLGVFYLGEKVLPKLAERGREVAYINTISIIHKVARVNFPRFDDSRGAYARSKLCLARYSRYLAEEYGDSNIRVYMSHPGIALTPIAAHFLGGMNALSKIVPINSAEKSSLAAAWILANEPPVGSVVGPNKLFGGWGYPKLNRTCRRAKRDIEPLIEFTNKTIEARSAVSRAPASAEGRQENVV
ncbi:MAG: SDR family NAD(P)-dependent oxidoreductase [Clostridia bacterium]|nr:SDR family NAD(P)-dependent oxidoreductase [Clostridia bacterium]